MLWLGKPDLRLLSRPADFFLENADVLEKTFVNHQVLHYNLPTGDSADQDLSCFHSSKN